MGVCAGLREDAGDMVEIAATDAAQQWVRKRGFLRIFGPGVLRGRMA